MLSIRKLFKKTTETKCACCQNKLFEESECPYFAGCCFCSNPDISEVTKQRSLDEFCLGDFQRCARYRLKILGKEIPQNMHPWQGE